ncbi:MAG: bifunctional histidine phosphatase family protein/GNAT family N-acetyltransferase [Clostridia bacterium]|nr:bifunctional histidine phosphatase family protein/GNAT family N-acetyltransferase [Clostridia bacterium]
MTEIYIIRHAEAEGNIGRRIHGHYNTLITANGLKQVEALQKRFENIRIDACYASDLTRTCMTSRAIYVPKGLKLNKDARYREVNLGIWEDLPFGYLYNFEDEKMRIFNDDPLHWSIERSENFEQYTSRFIDALTEAAEENEGKTIAIFTHGCILRGVQLKLFFDPEHPGKQHCDNTAVSRLFYENGRFTYDYLNDNSHLSPEISTLAKQNWWRSSGNTKDFNLYYEPLSDEQTYLDACEEIEQSLSRIMTREERLAQLEKLKAEGEIVTACLDGKPIGIVGTSLIKSIPDAACLDFIWLLPEYRQRDFAPQLIGQAISFARKHGCKKLLLQVGERNEAALRCYENQSFTFFGRSKRNPDELQLCRNIDPNQFSFD